MIIIIIKGERKAQSRPNRLLLSPQPDPGGPRRRVVNLPICLAVTGASNPISISFNYHPLQQATALFTLKRNLCPSQSSERVQSAPRREHNSFHTLITAMWLRWTTCTAKHALWGFVSPKKLWADTKKDKELARSLVVWCGSLNHSLLRKWTNVHQIKKPGKKSCDLWKKTWSIDN